MKQMIVAMIVMLAAYYLAGYLACRYLYLITPLTLSDSVWEWGRMVLRADVEYDPFWEQIIRKRGKRGKRVVTACAAYVICISLFLEMFVIFVLGAGSGVFDPTWLYTPVFVGNTVLILGMVCYILIVKMKKRKIRKIKEVIRKDPEIIHNLIEKHKECDLYDYMAIQENKNLRISILEAVFCEMFMKHSILAENNQILVCDETKTNPVEKILFDFLRNIAELVEGQLVVDGVRMALYFQDKTAINALIDEIMDAARRFTKQRENASFQQDCKEVREYIWENDVAFETKYYFSEIIRKMQRDQNYALTKEQKIQLLYGKKYRRKKRAYMENWYEESARYYLLDRGEKKLSRIRPRVQKEMKH